MLSYLKREYQTYGGFGATNGSLEDGTNTSTNTRATSDADGSYSNVKKNLPVKNGEYFCYRQRQSNDYIGITPSKFKLGMERSDNSISEWLYRGVLTGRVDLMTKISCEPKFYVSVKKNNSTSVTDPKVTVDGEIIAVFEFEAYIYDNTVSNAKVRRFDTTNDHEGLLGENQTKLVEKLLTPGIKEYSDSDLLLQIRQVSEIPNVGTEITQEITIGPFTTCMDDDTSEGGGYANTISDSTYDKGLPGISGRTIIAENMDGYWKIIQETIPITLKFCVEAYGTMGGAFRNWLVDSGFKKKEISYEYMRDDELVSATTVTYVTATAKGGINQPSRSQTDYNGQFTVLQPGDLIEVWYTEDRWAIKDAIYAKNFQSDTRAEGQIGPSDPETLIYRMNYIPAFSSIRNKSGRVKYRYDSGGFAQLDATNYTGLAIIFRFRCYGDNLYLEKNQQVPNIVEDDVAYIGADFRIPPGLYRAGTVYGYGAGYGPQEMSHDVTVSYTVLKPSDPEFTTGGDNYQESITSDLYDKVNDLQQQIYDMQASINVSGVTSSVFEAITNIGNLPDLFVKAVDAFTVVKEAFGALRRKTHKPKPIRATQVIQNNNSKLMQTATIENIMPSEVDVGIIYNTLRDKRKKGHHFDAFVLATETELPVIQRVNTLKPSFIEYLRKRDILPENAEIMEFDPMKKSVNFLLKEKADILSYKIDPEIADQVLGQMSSSAMKSLFSLNVRKQIMLDNNFSSKSYADLVDKILDDGELLDVTGKLSRNKLEEYVREFVDRIENLLGYYV
uniref:Viral structural protein 4 protease-sensitive n=1 Tax=Ruddy turnstone rotavirus TaxID=2212774 RepID=A0A3G1RPJ1_9REOV|nr:MAG: viral structural protein 4 protease-sensitive [Ruddy turnstone rotavirus]